MTQVESLWSLLKTEVLELREWPVFTDLVDAQVSVAVTIITTDYNPVSATRRPITFTNNYFKLLP